MYHRYDTPPTARQIQILGAIQAAIVATGSPPSLRELCRAIGNRPSKGGLESQLAALEVRRLIVREDGVERGIRVTRRGLDALPREVPP